MRCKTFQGNGGGSVHLYSSGHRIVLQVRREVPTELDVLGASFKSAIEIGGREALLLAAELLRAVSEIKAKV